MTLDNPPCPDCGEELDDLIGYKRGHKMSDGYECLNCDKWWLWEDWEEV